MSQLNKIIAVVGPTATGKSDLAVQVALHMKQAHNIECEIISADSRQIYKGLDIGTGKITTDEMHGITHHMLDVYEPAEKISVAEYKIKADTIIEEIYSRGHFPILCGGTGQYIDYVAQDISLPQVPPNQELRDSLEHKSLPELLALFHNLNKEQPHSVDLQNKRRVIRAIEIITALGHIPKTITSAKFDTLYIGLDADDETVKTKIKRRLDTRIEAGMIQESITLLEQHKITHDRMHTLGLEYAHISDFLEGKKSMEEFKSELFFAIWHYAKRQRTWFKKNKDIHWFYPEYDKGAMCKLAENFLLNK